MRPKPSFKEQSLYYIWDASAMFFVKTVVGQCDQFFPQA